MEERAKDFERAVLAHHQAAQVSQPADGAFNDPTFSMSAQRPAILRGWTNTIALVWTNQLDTAAGRQNKRFRLAVRRGVAPIEARRPYASHSTR
jgi:hypothetical protein